MSLTADIIELDRPTPAFADPASHLRGRLQYEIRHLERHLATVTAAIELARVEREAVLATIRERRLELAAAGGACG